MSFVELIIILVLVFLLCIWIISEILLYKSIKKEKRSYIWLTINIFFPIIGFLVYTVLNKNRYK